MYTNPYMNPYLMPQQQRQQIVKVTGMGGAQAFQMFPNSSALLLDENNPLLYLAQTDGAGYKTITTFKIEPFTPEPQVDSKSLEERIKKLEEAIYNGRESDTADARRSRKSSAAGTEHITE